MALPLSWRALRRPTTWLAAVILILLISYIPSPLSTWSPLAGSYYSGVSKYYASSAPSFFAPRKGASKGNCAGFPITELFDIQVSIKTTSQDKALTNANLETLSSCFQNILLFSDSVETYAGGIKSIDVLSELPLEYVYQDELMHAYKSNSSTLDRHKLDKYMYMPMVEHAHGWAKNAKWYVFLDIKTFYFWDVLFRLLDQLDPEKPHYIGSRAPGSHGRTYAYGGAGFVLSKGLYDKFIPQNDPRGNPTEAYMEWVKQDCCGDAVLGYAIKERVGVDVEGLYPIFAGDHLSELKIDRERWCTPLLAINGVSPELMRSLWWWERSRPYSKKTFTHSTLLSYTHAQLKRGQTQTDEWDNFSEREQGPKSWGSKDAASCAGACVSEKHCLQYSYHNGVCRLSDSIRMGAAVGPEKAGMVSGWNVDRMKKLGWSESKDWIDSCRIATWIRPNT